MERTETEEFIIGCISLLGNRLSQIGDGILPDITFKQWFLLVVISKMEEDQKSIRHIADIYGASRQNIKKLVMALEKKGYVRILQSQADSRALHVELTERAYDFFKKNEKDAGKAANQLFVTFSDEDLKSFMDNIQKLMKAIDLSVGSPLRG